MSARAFECRDKPYRSDMLARLGERHPGYFDAMTLDMSRSALIRALPQLVSIVDYSKGLGHSEIVTVGAGGAVVAHVFVAAAVFALLLDTVKVFLFQRFKVA
jgi:hypothetical protein